MTPTIPIGFNPGRWLSSEGTELAQICLITNHLTMWQSIVGAPSVPNHAKSLMES